MNEIVLGILMTTLLILLLTAGIVIAFFIAGRQRARQEKELAETKLAFEKEIRQVETEVGEHIMAQFAQELHDNIGQLLTAMHIQIENQKIDHPDLAHSFKPTEIYLGEVTQQLRLLSRTFNNDHLRQIGLLPALQVEVDRLQTLRRFRVHWHPVSGASHLEKDQELMVFRIFQEITQNALRHSAAQNLYVTLHNEDGAFELTVRDDGKGFDKKQVFQTHKASGLRNIMKRALLAGLVCEIDSVPDGGTRIVLKKKPS